MEKDKYFCLFVFSQLWSIILVIWKPTLSVALNRSAVTGLLSFNIDMLWLQVNWKPVIITQQHKTLICKAYSFGMNTFGFDGSQ